MQDHNLWIQSMRARTNDTIVKLNQMIALLDRQRELEKKMAERDAKITPSVDSQDDLLAIKKSKQVKNSPELKKLMLSKRPILDSETYLDICSGCNLPTRPELLEIDHIMPKARGGDNSIENRTFLCGFCNKSKGKKTWEEWKGVPFDKNIIYPRILISENRLENFTKLISKELPFEIHQFTPANNDSNITLSVNLKRKNVLKFGMLGLLPQYFGHGFIANFPSRNEFEDFIRSPEVSMEDIGAIITFIGNPIEEC